LRRHATCEADYAQIADWISPSSPQGLDGVDIVGVPYYTIVQAVAMQLSPPSEFHGAASDSGPARVPEEKMAGLCIPGNSGCQ
jgi:hypothetical protein